MTIDWRATYTGVIQRLPGLAAGAPPLFCGNGACMDARVSLHDVGAPTHADAPEAARFVAFLRERASRGQGGEVTYDWPGGPAWLAVNAPMQRVVGGTGPHAAWAVSATGARTVLALEDRSAPMLAVLPPEVGLVEGGRLVRAADALPQGAGRPPVFIFEYTARRPVGSVVPVRSSRIIVKFEHFALERDGEFDRYTVANAARAGAGLVSGFSSVATDDLPVETARVGALARSWRAGGLGTIHLELGGYDTPEMLRSVLDGLRGAITSVGMSLSELRAIRDDDDLRATMRAFADDLAVDRLCVHADDWAASLTKRDLAAEEEALLTGCLLAASRAAVGRPVLPTEVDPAATFAPPPFECGPYEGGWRSVACSAPHLRSPRTTLGLGDTFTGGCLLALGATAGTGRG